MALCSGPSGAAKVQPTAPCVGPGATVKLIHAVGRVQFFVAVGQGFLVTPQWRFTPGCPLYSRSTGGGGPPSAGYSRVLCNMT